jgi:hypothetical protein
MRALILCGTLALAGCAPEPLFVDQLEDGRAVLLDAHGRAYRLPASELPADAGEGRWLGGAPDPEAAARIAALRARLTRDDPGGDLVLP